MSTNKSKTTNQYTQHSLQYSMMYHHDPHVKHLHLGPCWSFANLARWTSPPMWHSVVMKPRTEIRGDEFLTLFIRVLPIYICKYKHPVSIYT